MEKFIPYEKLSKKEKRKIDAAKRTTWGDVNPVTRKPASSKAYNRNKSRNWKREMHETNSGMFIYRKITARLSCYAATSNRGSICTAAVSCICGMSLPVRAYNAYDYV